MRSAQDFNEYYKDRDPWGVQKESRSVRNRVFSKIAKKYASNKVVLELGCGEGNHTHSIFSKFCNKVTAVDISQLAIDRASEIDLPNVTFQASDFLKIQILESVEVIFALECLYYLNPQEQRLFLAKLKVQAKGKLFVMSAPIIGENQYRKYYTHPELMALFAEFGFEPIEVLNVSLYWKDKILDKALTFPVKVFNKLRLINSATIQLLPSYYIYQRCYVVRIS